MKRREIVHKERDKRREELSVSYDVPQQPISLFSSISKGWTRANLAPILLFRTRNHNEPRI